MTGFDAGQKIDIIRFYQKNKKIHISLKFYKLLSVTTLQVCFLGQRIHFWRYFFHLTKFTRNGGSKYPLLGQNDQNLKYLKI